jgi:uncharacterized protein
MHLEQPLSEKEFDDLDNFLLSERCPEGAMTLDTLHGYLTAIAIGPETIMPAEWLPHIWGEDGAVPKWKNPKEEERIVNLVMRFMNEVLITFEVAPKEFEPLYVEHEVDGETLIDAEAWCWGFWEGMELRPGSWEPIWESEAGPLMRPLYLLGADEIEESELQKSKTRARPTSWRSTSKPTCPASTASGCRAQGAVETVRHETPKVGRNDDCPCGSGKKYKKCCGADQPDNSGSEHIFPLIRGQSTFFDKRSEEIF